MSLEDPSTKSSLLASHCCFSSLRAGGSLARIYRVLQVFLCVAIIKEGHLKGNEKVDFAIFRPGQAVKLGKNCEICPEYNKC